MRPLYAGKRSRRKYLRIVQRAIKYTHWYNPCILTIHAEKLNFFHKKSPTNPAGLIKRFFSRL
ncbi:MAG TPA: hypothetical protein DDW84_01905 [Phycisphaerales bacterium]|nr:MAG: hypothetical protein A2Y13_02155 [Planctomycetes bacterium GWC2_45_44]HBG77591.1 hypothetical protein [Phycisphaerales bacterium]HBR20333.1 hypothetical protein [Phycisphaerales bacterium]